jgi:hypothetical protein
MVTSWMFARMSACISSQSRNHISYFITYYLFSYFTQHIFMVCFAVECSAVQCSAGINEFGELFHGHCQMQTEPSVGAEKLSTFNVKIVSWTKIFGKYFDL